MKGEVIVAVFQKEELMSKILMLASALTLTIGVPLAAPQPAKANHGVVAFCETISAEFPVVNLGECISYVRVPDKGFPAHLCDAILETEPEAFYEIYDDFTDCLHDLKENGGG